MAGSCICCCRLNFLLHLRLTEAQKLNAEPSENAGKCQTAESHLQRSSAVICRHFHQVTPSGRKSSDSVMQLSLVYCALSYRLRVVGSGIWLRPRRTESDIKGRRQNVFHRVVPNAHVGWALGHSALGCSSPSQTRWPSTASLFRPSAACVRWKNTGSNCCTFLRPFCTFFQTSHLRGGGGQGAVAPKDGQHVESSTNLATVSCNYHNKKLCYVEELQRVHTLFPALYTSALPRNPHAKTRILHASDHIFTIAQTLRIVL